MGPHLAEHHFPQFVYSPLTGCDYGYDRDLEAIGERVQVDVDAAADGVVHHVHGHGDRDAEVNELSDQVEVPVEIRGIRHDHDEPDVQVLVRFTDQHLPGDGIVEGFRSKAVHSRHVVQTQRRAVPTRYDARLLLHGHAGIVARFLAESGQRIENGSLAGIRIADEEHVVHGFTRRECIGSFGHVHGMDQVGTVTYPGQQTRYVRIGPI